MTLFLKCFQSSEVYWQPSNFESHCTNAFTLLFLGALNWKFPIPLIMTHPPSIIDTIQRSAQMLASITTALMKPMAMEKASERRTDRHEAFNDSARS